jgi:hypothetical protein
VYLVWKNDRPIADREMLAALYEVSERTVRRHCQPVEYRPRLGVPAGEGGAALYDVFTTATVLEGIAPRPERTVAMLSYRLRKRAA